MPQDTLLIIEDDPDIVELLQYNLQKEGYSVLAAIDGEAGLASARRHVPDLILLDLMMPGINGLDVCRALKADEGTSAIPVIMVTAKDEESDVVLGLELGADDYVSKPFGMPEVLARVRAVLRRSKQVLDTSRTTLTVGDLHIDQQRFEAHVDGQLLDLTRAEFRLLWALVSQPGRVFTRDQLVEHITAGEAMISDRNVDVHVSALRRKMATAGGLITTVRGVGYKCKD